jgi:hypothetical protein
MHIFFITPAFYEPAKYSHYRPVQSTSLTPEIENSLATRGRFSSPWNKIVKAQNIVYIDLDKYLRKLDWKKSHHLREFVADYVAETWHNRHNTDYNPDNFPEWFI